MKKLPRAAGGCMVFVFPRELREFAAHWPCAHLPFSTVFFEFADNGDLVDLSSSLERADRVAVLALMENARRII